MLQAGNYKVKTITECFIGESGEKKTPFFCLQFKLENGETIPWTVYLSSEFSSEAHRNMAKKNVETLVKLGFKGSKIEDMAEGLASELFDEIEDEISITVDLESYTAKDGSTKEKPRVKFVNVGSFGFNKIDKKQAAVAMKSLSHNGFLIESRKSVKANVKTKPVDSSVSSEDIPF